MSGTKTITYTDEELARIKEAVLSSKDPTEVLENIYLYVFGVDLKDENLLTGEVKSWEYHMAEDLLSEFMEYSFTVVEEHHRMGVSMMWLNYGPSSKTDLKTNEVRREWEDV